MPTLLLSQYDGHLGRNKNIGVFGNKLYPLQWTVSILLTPTHPDTITL